MKIFHTIIAMTCAFISQEHAHSGPVKKYVVGVEGIPFLPYSNVEKSKYYGILRDIMDKFAKKASIEVTYIPLPINRLYADFYNGKIDFKLPANEYWQKDIKKKRELSIVYSLPVVSFTDGLMLRPEKVGGDINSLKKLGVVSGFTPWEYLDRIKSGKISIRENPSLTGLLQQGILGRVDGIYINVSVGKHYLKEDLKKEKSLKFDPSLPHTRSNYHLATIKHPELIRRFNDFLKKNEKELKLLKKSYEIPTE